MKISIVAVISLMLVLLPFAAPAQGDRPVLTWMVLDLPPGSKPVNGELTDGINDVMLKLVFAEMPELRHQIMVVNTARAISNLSEGVASQQPDRAVVFHALPRQAQHRGL